MKMKSIVSVLFFGFTMLLANPVKAQFQEGSSIAGVNMGASLISHIFNAVQLADKTYLESTQIPSLQLSYDYKITRKFSLGVAGSIAFANAKYDNPNFENVVDTALQNFKASLTRYNIALRALYYYDKSDNFDLYSGLRGGLNIWRLKLKSDDPDLELGVNPFNKGFFATPVFPGLQVILFGASIYPIETVGINFELAIGQPYYASIGAKYRF